MKYKLFYIELLCRNVDPEDYSMTWKRMKLGRPDCCALYLPVRYAWQEDANDLHIQLDTPYGRDHGNVCPVTHKGTGDYIIPSHPWLLKHLGKDFNPATIPNHFGEGVDGILVYHLAWLAQPRYADDDGAVVSKEYLDLLETKWDMMN